MSPSAPSISPSWGKTRPAIRLTDKQSADRLRQIGGIRILTRGDGELVALFENRYRLQRLMSDEPELTLEPIIADATVL